MTQLMKLGIQGIRSFGPDEFQRIQFHSPLTLILGQNGCGKTTIIESLKFVTTGEAPPGCGKGAPFVHDPKMAKEYIVRGQIKLRFLNSRGQIITACRTVEVIQKVKKLEFSTLDSTITIQNSDGAKKSISNKCIDFYSEITYQMGVSKPILENVIFCHQEESNWPLDEGKKVKDKFDSIFNATKYIKCLETIRKLRKDKKTAITNMKETLEALKVSKEQADLLRKDLKNVEENLKQVQKQLEQLDAEKQPIREKLNTVLQLLNNIAQMREKLKLDEQKLTSLRERQKELRINTTESFEGQSDTELFRLICDFDEKTQNQRREQKDLMANLNVVTSKMENFKKEESKVLAVVSRLQAAHNAHLTNVEERNQVLASLVQKHSFFDHLDERDFDEVATEDVIGRLKSILANVNSKLDVLKRDFGVKEEAIQKDIENIRTEETTLSNEISMTSSQIKQQMKKIMDTESNLTKAERKLSASDTGDLKRDLEEVRGQIAEQERAFDFNETNKKISCLKRERSSLEAKLDDVKKEVTKVNHLMKESSKLDIFVKQRKELEQKNKFLKSKNADDFQTIFGNSLGDTLGSQFEARLSDIRRQVMEVRDKESKLESSKSECGLKIENERTNIERKEKLIKDFRSKLERITSGGDLEGEIVRKKQQLENINKSIGDQASTVELMQRFKDKISQGEACPLCHRDFDSMDYKQDLVQEIEGKLHRHPRTLQKLKADLSSEQTTYDRLMQLKPLKTSADEALREVEICRANVTSLQSSRERLSLELESNSAQLLLLVEEEETCMRVQSDVVTFDNNAKSVRQLNETISKLQLSLNDKGLHQSIDQLQNNQSDLEFQLTETRSHIERLQEQLMQHDKRLKTLREKQLHFSDELSKVQSLHMEVEKLRKDLEDANEEMRIKEKTVMEKKELEAPIKRRLEEKLGRKRDLLSTRDRELTRQNNEIQSVRTDISSVEHPHLKIVKYDNENQESILRQKEEQLKEFRDKLEEYTDKRDSIKEKINGIEQDLNLQIIRKRNLDNEKKIRELEREAEAVTNAIESSKLQIGNSKFEDILQKRDDLTQRQNRVDREISNFEGRQNELRKKEADLESNLASRAMKNAHKNYLQKLINIKCIEIACDDLNKYYRALETAVMKFHKEKMTAINTIIRELWRSTYRGNDIDYIEIKTDEVESQGADKRRTYNYRVVMVKNDTEMDMRGRCSSGQKVLASLIIRMALAETFSSNCGILALDEPTTNLDRENIEALSLALLNIVNRRSSHKNFQLIVITHDDEFHDRLTRADFIEFYYKVSRNNR